MPMVDSCWCMAKTNAILLSNYSTIKMNNLKNNYLNVILGNIQIANGRFFVLMYKDYLISIFERILFLKIVVENEL